MEATFRLLGWFKRVLKQDSKPNGDPVMEFLVKTTRHWKSSSGEPQSEANMFVVTAYGSHVDVIERHVEQGDPISITGDIVQESWTHAASGEKRHKTRFILRSFKKITIGSDYEKREEGEG